MFQVKLTDIEDGIDLKIQSLGLWTVTDNDDANWNYRVVGHHGETIIDIFLQPLTYDDLVEEYWDAVLVMRRVNTPIVMCRLGCRGLDVLADRINATLRAWENL